jgi:hypothetical protein
MADPVVSHRALNRATLARQFLLDRADIDVPDAVTHLIGLQAQNPLDPYLALWARLRDFDPGDLGGRIAAREFVRIVVIRGTIHLVTGDDAFGLRPLMQPVLDAEIRHHSEFAPLLVGVDLAPVMAFADRLLSERPLTAPKLRAALGGAFPERDSAALAYACRCLLPLVQVPPRGVWGKTSAVTSATLHSWLGSGRDAPTTHPTIDDLARRYLAAFGPATVADFATFTRLTGLRAVFDRLGPSLITVQDERGRTLFDLPDARRPDPDTPAPVRLLPEYDNVLLSHADRSRFGPFVGQRMVGPRGPYKGALLVDGELQGIWHTELDRIAKTSTLVVELLVRTAAHRAEVEAEAARTAEFWLPSGTRRDVIVRDP